MFFSFISSVELFLEVYIVFYISVILIVVLLIVIISDAVEVRGVTISIVNLIAIEMTS